MKREDGEEARKLVEEGNRHFIDKDYDQAAAAYQKAAELDPGYARGWYGWGDALVEQNSYPEAIEKFQKATELDPNDAYAWYSWGNILSDQKEYESSLVCAI
jgi:tetratricopeptide (TPR) repeat protein